MTTDTMPEEGLEVEQKLYDQVICETFRRIYKPDTKTLYFAKDEPVRVCQDLNHQQHSRYTHTLEVCSGICRA